MVGALFTNFLLYALKHERLDYWDPNIFLVSLAVGVMSLVIVSVLIRPEPEIRIEPFFAQLETPSDLTPDDAIAEGCALNPPDLVAGTLDSDPALNRWAAEKSRQLLLVHLLHLRRGACGVSFFKAYHDDLKGLPIGFALSAGSSWVCGRYCDSNFKISGASHRPWKSRLTLSAKGWRKSRSRGIESPLSVWWLQSALQDLHESGIREHSDQRICRVDFSDPELDAKRAISVLQAIWKTGATSFCATLITKPIERLGGAYGPMTRR